MIPAEARQAARMLVLFHRVLADEVGEALVKYLESPGIDTYVALARILWDQGTGLQAHLVERILYDENAFTLAAEAGGVPDGLISSARGDLRHLALLWRTEPDAGFGAPPLPPYAPAPDGIRRAMAESPDWAALAPELAAHIGSQGAGEMGRYRAFRWERGALRGIADPDPVTLDDLVGNSEAKAVICRNTEQFLAGLPANNLLLYGDRGTGKSSTVKALIHRYGGQGLRLLEVSRSELREIGAVMQRVRGRALRFILFIDDLSFEEFEAEYKTFKAVLEGSLERRPANVLVYATSNRKHLIRERWGDRPSPADEEVHAGDTMQEKLSLADRFGLTVIFATPDQEEYLRIVRSLAEQRRIEMPWEELRRLALQWELWQNGRSGRTARQFIDDLCGRLGIPAR
jgi:uncharacterized protein